MFLSFCLSVCQSVYLSTYLSVFICLSVWLHASFVIYSLIYMFTYLFSFILVTRNYSTARKILAPFLENTLRTYRNFKGYLRPEECLTVPWCRTSLHRFLVFAYCKAQSSAWTRSVLDSFRSSSTEFIDIHPKTSCSKMTKARLVKTFLRSARLGLGFSLALWYLLLSNLQTKWAGWYKNPGG